MPHYFFLWSLESLAKIAEHGVSQDDFIAIVCDCQEGEEVQSRTSGRLVAFGEASDGRVIACVYDRIRSDVVPITAYYLED